MYEVYDIFTGLMVFEPQSVGSKFGSGFNVPYGYGREHIDCMLNEEKSGKRSLHRFDMVLDKKYRKLEDDELQAEYNCCYNYKK